MCPDLDPDGNLEMSHHENVPTQDLYSPCKFGGDRWRSEGKRSDFPDVATTGIIIKKNPKSCNTRKLLPLRGWDL